jgi:hypothetical protein
VSSDVSTEHWLEDKFKFEVAAGMLLALRQGKELKLRFYAGAYPITLWVHGNNWKKLQINFLMLSEAVSCGMTTSKSLRINDLKVGTLLMLEHRSRALRNDKTDGFLNGCIYQSI